MRRNQKHDNADLDDLRDEMMEHDASPVIVFVIVGAAVVALIVAWAVLT